MSSTSGKSARTIETNNPVWGDIGKRLRLIRGGMSQAEFANAVGASINSYARYERGEREIGAGLLAHLCAQGWNINWLLTGFGLQRSTQMDNPSQQTRPPPPPTNSTYAALTTLREATLGYGHKYAINPETWDRATRIVALAADAIEPKPSDILFAVVVADIYGEISGKAHNNGELPSLVERSTSALVRNKHKP